MTTALSPRPRWILVVEARGASPIWAVMMLSPSGEVIQQQIKPGLLILLSLILRPILMLFGLTAALALMFVGTYLVEQTIIPAMVFTGAKNSTQVLATFVLYVGLLVFMANYTFKLINTLPDEVLKYIGHTGDGKAAQTSDQLTQAAESNITGLGSFLGNSEADNTPSIGSGTTDGNKNNNDLMGAAISDAEWERDSKF